MEQSMYKHMQRMETVKQLGPSSSLDEAFTTWLLYINSGDCVFILLDKPKNSWNLDFKFYLTMKVNINQPQKQ